MQFCPSYHLPGASSLPLDVSFFGVIQHSSVDSCSTASSNFGVLTGEDEHRSFYSTILYSKLPLLLLLGEKNQPGNQALQLYYSIYIHCTFHFISGGVLEIK